MSSNDNWKPALRRQIETLAQRNDASRRRVANDPDDATLRQRVAEMDARIVRLRELVTRSPNDAALFYLECLAAADENDGDATKSPRRCDDSAENSGTISLPSETTAHDVIQTVDISQLDANPKIPQRPHWWDQLQLYRRSDLLGQVKQNDRRELWLTQKDFFLACLGFMVGVGHTMRFPAKVYQHGGGVFFIPYIFSLIFFGLPLVFLHLSIGQYTGQAANTAFSKLMPIGAGVGWALVVIAIPVAIYYNIIVAWAIHYFFLSVKGTLNGKLPWEYCGEEWQLDSKCCNLHRLHECFNATNTITAPEAFFHSEVLSLSTFGDFTLGPLQTHLVLSLAVAWLLVFFGVFKGLGSIASTMNVTATVPYFLLSTLLLRGISLPGANKGLAFLFSVDGTKLWKWQIWKSAAEQVFYELGIDAGPLISMAAFSRYRNNVYRDSVLLVMMDALTSTLCAMVIFSFVGFIASESNTNVDDVLQHDPLYLSFTVYPGVTSFMNWGGLWAMLFFGMIVLAALDAEFAWLEMIASAFMNHFSTKNKAIENRLQALLCLLGFFFGLPLCAQGGIYIFHAVENLNANWNSFSLALLSVVIVCYVYGIDNYLTDISQMLRVRRVSFAKATRMRDRVVAILGPGGIYIKFSLLLVCPVVLTILLMASVFGYQRISFAARPIPIEYEFVAWLVMIGPLLVVPLVAFLQIRQTRKEGKLLKSLFDTSDWCHQQEEEEDGDEMNRGGDSRDVANNATNRRRTPTIFTHRENTYMYIESRGPTIRGGGGGESRRVFPTFDATPSSSYGWQAGRIREHQLAATAATTTSPPPIVASQNNDVELTLFGAPPAMKEQRTRFAESLPINHQFRQERILDATMAGEVVAAATRRRASPSASDPPIPTTPLPPPPFQSMARSEPPSPSLQTDRRSMSSSSSRQSYSLDDDDDEGGFESNNRPTVIRKTTATSDDDAFTFVSTSSAANVAETISITPLDDDDGDEATSQSRQRSLSSVALYDQDKKVSKSQVLSQLKRPAPIDMPPG